MTALLLNPVVRWWRCPSCDVTDRTERNDAHTQFHNCPALGGVSIPLIEVPAHDARPDGRQLVVEREDYAGHDSPIAAIRTERGDGSNDCTVFVPTATSSASAT